MNPRSPPARPHIGINLSHFSTTAEWGEDDAWDSTSDSESPRQSTLNTSWSRPSASGSSSTAPKTVPRRTSNASSSSTLAFSYTHLQAPGSYPKQELASVEPPKNGWTIVRTSHSRQGSQNRLDVGSEHNDPEFGGESGDVDVEGDMILGDLEPDTHATNTNTSGGSSTSNSKPKANMASFRPDIDDIVNGMYACSPFFPRSSISYVLSDPLNGIRNRSRQREPSPIPIQKPNDTNKKAGMHTREKSEKLMRERSIRTNRRHKFVECLSSQDVNIGTHITSNDPTFLFNSACRRTTKTRLGWHPRRPSTHGLATSPCWSF